MNRELKIPGIYKHFKHTEDGTPNNYNETKRKATKYEFIEKTFEEIIKMNNKDKNTYLNKLTKDKLLELCKNNNIEIKKSWSKNKIIDKINLYKA